MDQVCFALPLLPNQTAAARAFLSELEGRRRGAYRASERRIGILRQSWYLQPLAACDVLLGYIESGDVAEARRLLAHSQDEFDVWFKLELSEVTGADWNAPPCAPLSERLSFYEELVPPR
jgi:hypothetical protein